MEHTPKTELIEKILDVELEMFQAVPTLHRAACQDDPEGFRLIRTAQFITWSERTLKSYLDDVFDAQRSGRNLMTEKYARMDGLIPCRNPEPTIELIVAQQLAWQVAMAQKYPNLMARARPLAAQQDTSWQTSFQTYLRGELETYSSRTLGLLHEDMGEKKKKNLNMAAELYDHMVRAYGYGSLGEAEAQAAAAKLRNDPIT